MKFGALVAALAIVASSATAVDAHHAVNAQFDVAKELPMTATLKEIKVVNPHSQWIFVASTPKAGTTWVFEGLSPNAIRRAGVKVREDLTSGKPYTFTYSPSRDGSPAGLLTSITINGKVIRMTPA